MDAATDLPADDRPACVHPRQLTDMEQAYQALTRLQGIRRLISAAVREQLTHGKDLEPELRILLEEEDRALAAMVLLTEEA